VTPAAVTTGVTGDAPPAGCLAVRDGRGGRGQPRSAGVLGLGLADSGGRRKQRRGRAGGRAADADGAAERAGVLSTLVVGTPSLPLVAVIVAGVTAAVVLVLAGTVAGAWAERQSIPVALEAAADEGILGARDLASGPCTAGVAAVRLLGLVPVVVAVALAFPSLYAATYHELVLPAELVTPLPLRVVGDVPWVVAALGLTWLLADAAAALGVRRLVLEGRRIPAACLLGWRDLVRRPATTLGTAAVGLLVLAVLLGPALLAASAGWSRVREVLLEGRDPATVFVTVVGWVAIWLGGLVLAGVGAAVRAAAWTLESARRD
jgi:hypothetical protein